jgi:hypothetical protein
MGNVLIAAKVKANQNDCTECPLSKPTLKEQNKITLMKGVFSPLTPLLSKDCKACAAKGYSPPDPPFKQGL